MSKGTSTEVYICGRNIRLGDELRVRYTQGVRMKNAEIKGTVTEIWSHEKDNHLQVRLSCGWCFHNEDEIISYKAASDGES